MAIDDCQTNPSLLQSTKVTIIGYTLVLLKMTAAGSVGASSEFRFNPDRESWNKKRLKCKYYFELNRNLELRRSCGLRCRIKF